MSSWGWYYETPGGVLVQVREPRWAVPWAGGRRGGGQLLRDRVPGTVQYSTVQYRIVQNSTLQYCDTVFQECRAQQCHVQSPGFPGVYPRGVSCRCHLQ